MVGGSLRLGLVSILLADNTWYLLNIMVQSTGYYVQHVIQVGWDCEAFQQLAFEMNPSKATELQTAARGGLNGEGGICVASGCCAVRADDMGGARTSAWPHTASDADSSNHDEATVSAAGTLEFMINPVDDTGMPILDASDVLYFGALDQIASTRRLQTGSTPCTILYDAALKQCESRDMPPPDTPAPAVAEPSAAAAASSAESRGGTAPSAAAAADTRAAAA